MGRAGQGLEPTVALCAALDVEQASLPQQPPPLILAVVSAVESHGQPAAFDVGSQQPGPGYSWTRAILHLDLDAFFVGVHLLDHLEDRGRPVAVGGSASSRGVISSASYEARRFGVRSGMPTRHAFRLCPQLKVVPPHWERIHASSGQVMAILARCGPTEPTSVDEAYVDLSAASDPTTLAAQIRDQVVAETGLSASVGLAACRLVAKVASDQGKPGGCVVVPPGTEAAFLAPLNIRVIPGIGPRTTQRLNALGIHTCADLALADPEVLARQLGPHAASLPARAQGHDSRPVRPERGPPKSLSGEITFDRDVADRERLLAAVTALSARVGRRLRRQAMVAQTVYVKFRWADFTTFSRQRSLPVPCDDDASLAAAATAIWLAHWPPGQKVRLVGVGVSGLEPAGPRQLSLDMA